MVGPLALLATLALLVWLGQLALRGGFWRADQRLPDVTPDRTQWPAVMAVVPARNEASVVGQAVGALLDQDYAGRFEVVLVDDHSDDCTAERACGVALERGMTDRLHIVQGAPLPTGWTGKMWAVEQGVQRAASLAATPYLLLTDADILHDRESLRRLVAKAEHDRLDLVSLMVLLQCRSFWERLLIPAFVFFFQMLYPFPLVNRPASRTAAAAGGCMLVRRDALARAGGIAAIRGAIIDDCALARMIKAGSRGMGGQESPGQGGAIWLGLTERVRSLRPYDTLDEIWSMVARSAYTQLNHSPLLLLGTLLGMTLVFVVPPLGVLLGLLAGAPLAAAPALLAWLIMAVAYRPTLRLYREPALAALGLPLAALLYTAMTVDSARRHRCGRGGAWKGRSYARDPRPSI